MCWIWETQSLEKGLKRDLRVQLKSPCLKYNSKLNYLKSNHLRAYFSCIWESRIAPFGGPQHFWHKGLVLWMIIFPLTKVRMVWGWFKWFIYCVLYFYYFYIVICNELIIQLTIMQNQREPWAFFLQLDGSIWGLWKQWHPEHVVCV